jgi:hypothetical protein
MSQKSKRASRKRKDPAAAVDTQVNEPLALILKELQELKKRVDDLSTPSSRPQHTSPADTVAAAGPSYQQALVGQAVQPMPASPQMLLAHAEPVPASQLPETSLIPANIKKDIVNGKDVNLATLLIPLRERKFVQSGQREIRVGDDVIALKPQKDNRLLKNINCADFIQAFTIYKDIMCEAYPSRRAELDKYMSIIVKMAGDWPGFVFYQYHTEFSARSAELLERGYRVDWAKLDAMLYQKVTAGKLANSCKLCNAFDHHSGFCPLAASGAKTAPYSKPQSPDFKTCLYFNKGNCTRNNCPYIHACGKCASPQHRAQDCKNGKSTPRGAAPSASSNDA